MSGPNILSGDHAEVDELFAAAFAALDRGEDSFARVDLLWARLAVHIRAEHLHLFPTLSTSAEQRADAALLKTLGGLRDDHDHFMKTLASVVSDLRHGNLSDVRERLADVAARLVKHNAVEEDKVYPLVEKYLEEADRRDLYRRILKELQNAPPRFSDTVWRRHNDRPI
jgi:hemerythrin superfamily protein